MKLFFKTLLLLIITTLGPSQTRARAIIMSGRMSAQQRLMVERIIVDLIGRGELINWEGSNPSCIRRPGYLLQICWRGTELRIVYQKEAMLKNTIGRLIKMGKNEKAFIAKASL